MNLNKSVSVIGYNDRLEPIVEFENYIELGWYPKLNEAGEFTLYLFAEDYKKITNKISFIKPSACKNWGIVQSVTVSDEPEGTFVTLAGQMFDAVLDMGALMSPVTVGTAASQLIKSVVESTGLTVTFEQLQDFNLSLNMETLSDIRAILNDELFKNRKQLSFTPIYENGLKAKVNLIDATDKTQSCFVGKTFENVDKIYYKFDESATKTKAIITGEDNAIVMSYEAEQFNLKGLEWCNNIKPICHTSGSEDVTAEQTAENLLKEHQRQEEVECTVLPADNLNCELGDIVTLIINELNAIYYAQVIEIREVHKDNTFIKEFIFGNFNKKGALI